MSVTPIDAWQLHDMRCLVQVLLAADSREQVVDVMEDMSQLKVVPLLQGVLFGR